MPEETRRPVNLVWCALTNAPLDLESQHTSAASFERKLLEAITGTEPKPEKPWKSQQNSQKRSQKKVLAFSDGDLIENTWDPSSESLSAGNWTREGEGESRRNAITPLPARRLSAPITLQIQGASRVYGSDAEQCFL